MDKPTPAVQHLDGLTPPIHRADKIYIVSNETRVPYLYMTESGKTSDSGEPLYYLGCDNRFETHEPVSEHTIMNLAAVIAHAIAIGGGYTHHGPESKPLNPHVTRMSPLPRMPLELV